MIWIREFDAYASDNVVPLDTLITGAVVKVFVPEMVWVEFKLTAVPTTDATGTVPLEIDAPLQTGGSENDLMPATVWAVVVSTGALANPAI
jgi:hypothetical protein